MNDNAKTLVPSNSLEEDGCTFEEPDTKRRRLNSTVVEQTRLEPQTDLTFATSTLTTQSQSQQQPDGDINKQQSQQQSQEAQTQPAAQAQITSFYDFTNPQCVVRATKCFHTTYDARKKWVYGGNFLKGIYWSPDGTSLLSNSNDRTLRMFHPFNVLYQSSNTEQTDTTATKTGESNQSNDNDDENSNDEGMGSAEKGESKNNENENENKNDSKLNEFNNCKQMRESVRYKHSEPVNDVSFYPLYNQSDYNTWKFVSASRDSPIYMFDAWQNKKRANYSYQVADAVLTPFSLSFDPTGNYIIAGYEQYIIEYNVHLSDSCDESINNQIFCVNRNKFGQKGIISCLQFYNNNINLFASGSYDGICQLFDRRMQYAFAGFREHLNGISCIKFSPCGNYLLTGARKGNHILCWDLRKLKTSLPYFFQNDNVVTNININNNNNNNNKKKKNNYDGNTRVLKNDKYVCAIYERNIINCQKVLFDIDRHSGKYIVSGNHDGYVSVYDVFTNNFIVPGQYNNSNEKLKHPCRAVTSAVLNPCYPYLATTSGERVFEFSQYKRPVWKVKKKQNELNRLKKKNEKINNTQSDESPKQDTTVSKNENINESDDSSNDSSDSSDSGHSSDNDSSDSSSSDTSDSDSSSDDSSDDVVTSFSATNVNDIYIWDLSVKHTSMVF